MSHRTRPVHRNPARGGSSARAVVVVLAVAAIVLAMAYKLCPSVDSGPQTVAVLAFSVMEEVLEVDILPAFRAQWERQTGERVEFITTFAGSGEITESIATKVPADIAVLASEIDALRLAERGVVLGSAWRDSPHKGVISRSPMVLVVREGNPGRIAGFGDLTRPGIRVVAEDPATSGAGEWTILAVYASSWRATGDPAVAEGQVAAFRGNVSELARSARAAGTRFAAGIGDVLVTYEKEAVGKASFAGGSIVRPPVTVMSEHVAVRIQGGGDTARDRVVDALYEFLWSEDAQAMLSAHGFRPAIGERLSDPERIEIEDAVTLDDLGGPRRVRGSVLESAWDAGEPQRSAAPARPM